MAHARFPGRRTDDEKEKGMARNGLRWMTATLALLCLAANTPALLAEHRDDPLAIVMTNGATSNQIKVYDVATHVLLQTLSTHGKGGVAGNARGVRQFNGELVAAVNNGSNTIAIFKRRGDRLAFDRLVNTTSAPVSIDFGADHMYVAGATTVDSFVLRHGTVQWMDGTAPLEVAGGGVPAPGSTAQVGFVNRRQLLVTLKTDPDPGTVDVVRLDDGAVTGDAPTAVSAPAGTLTPFGFDVYPDGTALITLAHSNHDGLFRDGAFRDVVAAGQAAPCWLTRAGKYAFTANTGSGTISRLIGTGNHVFVDNAVAAHITTGGAPSDIDGAAGVLGVVDRGAGQSHVSLFTYNRFGELRAHGLPITVGVATANGIAIMPPVERD
jgi:hypothetical protein